MSAFVLNEKHISALIGYLHLNVPGYEDASELDELANILLRENIRSVNYRYNDNESYPDIKVLPEHLVKDFPFTSADIYNAARCYRYQSCEHPDFFRSQACTIVNAIIVDTLENIDYRKLHLLLKKAEIQWVIS